MNYTCPIGNRCEARDDNGNVTERCRWFKPLPCQRISTGEVEEVWDCAVGHIIQLGMDAGQQASYTGEAVDAVRNLFAKALNPPAKLEQTG